MAAATMDKVVTTRDVRGRTGIADSLQDCPSGRKPEDVKEPDRGHGVRPDSLVGVRPTEPVKLCARYRPAAPASIPPVDAGEPRRTLMPLVDMNRTDLEAYKPDRDEP